MKGKPVVIVTYAGNPGAAHVDGRSRKEEGLFPIDTIQAEPRTLLVGGHRK